MKLKSFGCSFIFGTDLSDCLYDKNNLYPAASRLTWPALIADRLDMPYTCRAHGGSGNLAILDRLLNDVMEQSQPCFYVIGWSYIDRLDYRDQNGGPTGSNDWSTLRPHSNDEISKIFYKNINSEYHDKISSLIYISTAIDILKSTNHKFVMTLIDDLVLDQKFHVSPGILALQEKVKKHTVEFDGSNFLEWSRNQNFSISPNNHPLEDAHSAAANYMLPIIESILHKA